MAYPGAPTLTLPQRGEGIFGLALLPVGMGFLVYLRVFFGPSTSFLSTQDRLPFPFGLNGMERRRRVEVGLARSFDFAALRFAPFRFAQDERRGPLRMCGVGAFGSGLMCWWLGAVVVQFRCLFLWYFFRGMLSLVHFLRSAFSLR